MVYAVNAKGKSDPPYIIERVRTGSMTVPYGRFSVVLVIFKLEI